MSPFSEQGVPQMLLVCSAPSHRPPRPECTDTNQCPRAGGLSGTLPAPHPHKRVQRAHWGVGKSAHAGVSPIKVNRLSFHREEQTGEGVTVKFGCSNSCESCGYKFKTIAMTESLLPSTFYNFIAKEIGLAFILLCFF